MLRDLANTWAAGNVPDPVVRRDFLRSFDAATRKKIDFFFVIGSKLTQKRKAYLVHCYAEELFIFQLNPKQAKDLGVRPISMTCTEGHACRSPNHESPVLLSLQDMRLENGSFLRGTESVIGSCRYTLAGHLSVPYVLQLECALQGRNRVRNLAYPVDQLESEGILPFTFESFSHLGSDNPWHGTTALFFRVFSLPPTETIETCKPISNSCAMLVDVVA